MPSYLATEGMYMIIWLLMQVYEGSVCSVSSLIFIYFYLFIFYSLMFCGNWANGVDKPGNCNINLEPDTGRHHIRFRNNSSQGSQGGRKEN